MGVAWDPRARLRDRSPTPLPEQQINDAIIALDPIPDTHPDAA
ncbi:MAG: hypothetical protein R2743_25905 [Ilumatobacteraceae bacterium]